MCNRFTENVTKRPGWNHETAIGWRSKNWKHLLSNLFVSTNYIRQLDFRPAQYEMSALLIAPDSCIYIHYTPSVLQFGEFGLLLSPQAAALWRQSGTEMAAEITTIPRGWRFVSNGEWNSGQRFHARKSAHDSGVRQLRHIFLLAESLCSSVFVSSLHRTDPSRRGLLDFFGFTELFKTYTIYTYWVQGKQP